MSSKKLKSSRVKSSRHLESEGESSTMGERQTSDRRGAGNVSTRIIPEELKESFLPSYVKSFSQTRFEMITFDYTWSIERFKRFSKSIDTLESPSFPENGRYKIKMNVVRDDNALNTIQLFICTDTDFTGACITTVSHPPENHLSTKTVSGPITNMTLLIEFSQYNDEFVFDPTLIIRCKIEIFHKLINNTVHMNLTPASTIYKDVITDEDLIPDFKHEDSIKFILGDEYYVVPKKLLYATNSDYFKDICLTHEGKEKDMTDELTTRELLMFEQILLYILAGSLEQGGYNMLKELLVSADKFDVPALKLTCEHYLLRHLSNETAVELMQAALSANAKLLEKHAAAVIKLHIKELVSTKEFRDLEQEESNKLMELIEKEKILESCTEFGAR